MKKGATLKSKNGSQEMAAKANNFNQEIAAMMINVSNVLLALTYCNHFLAATTTFFTQAFKTTPFSQLGCFRVLGVIASSKASLWLAPLLARL